MVDAGLTNDRTSLHYDIGGDPTLLGVDYYIQAITTGQTAANPLGLLTSDARIATIGSR